MPLRPETRGLAVGFHLFKRQVALDAQLTTICTCQEFIFDAFDHGIAAVASRRTG